MLRSNVHNDQWSITIQKLIPLCCQKLRFQRWCNNTQLFHFPSLHRNPKVTIKSWFPYAAVQYSWWPMANNSKVDSSVLPKLRFWGWCKIPSCSFPIVALQSNFPNRQYKTSSDSWLLILLWVYLPKYSSSRKIVQSLTVFPLARIEKVKNGVFHVSSFWLGM